MVNQQVRLRSRQDGIPQAAHFEIVETDIPRPQDGQVLVRNRFLRSSPPCAAGSATWRTTASRSPSGR